MRVVIVAAPLAARSGVYRSTVDLVQTARRRGLDWHATIGVRADAAGQPVADTGAIDEIVITDHGPGVAREVRRRTAVAVADADADVVITMVPQSDLAIAAGRSTGRALHVAWVRGLPWPGVGEQSHARRWMLRAASRWALGRADAVWATTPLLRDEIRRAASARVVPAGVPLRARLHDGSDAGSLVFAGRVSAEKNAGMVVALARTTAFPARMHGEGPGRAALERASSAGVTWAGWSTADEIWGSPGVFLCPSFREAFGRSAVEAASVGMPMVLSDRTGVAPFLIQDPELAGRFILPPDDHRAWETSVRTLRDDPAMRRRLSDHVSENARSLSIDASLDAAISAIETLPRRNA